MPFNQNDLDAINQAIASAELSVRFSDGKEVRYRTMDELLKARDLISQELVAATPDAPSRQVRIVTSKGW